MNIRIVLAVVLALCTQPWLTASAAQPQLSGYATTGYEYDSNVSIDAIDSNTGESDSAWVIDLGIDATVPVSTHSKLLFGYAYNDTRYQDFPEFDLAIHHLYGGIGHSFRGFDGELAVNRFVARLDDAGFVDITYVPLSVSRLIGMRWYLRGSVAHTRKDYAELDERVNAGWPDYEAALQEHGKTFEAFFYPGANHGFHNDTTPRYDAEAAELAWQRTLDHFERYLT